MREQEFLQSLQQHQKIIHKICNMYLHDAADREDLFQEIILQAWKSFPSFRGEAKFSTWLYRVALNTAITYFKKDRQQNFHYTNEFPDVPESFSPIEQQAQALYKAIAGLSKIDKALVMLYLDDYSYREMADVLGITVTNVGVKMNRIKTKLKEQAVKFYHPAN